MNTAPIPSCPAILIERICAPIRECGLPILTAAALVGIDPDLWPALCPRGSELALAVQQAEAQFMYTLLKLLFAPSIPGQRVNKAEIRAILERRYPGEWARRKGGTFAPLSPHMAQVHFDSHQSVQPFAWPSVEDDLPPANDPPCEDVAPPLPAKPGTASTPAARAQSWLNTFNPHHASTPQGGD